MGEARAFTKSAESLGSPFGRAVALGRLRGQYAVEVRTNYQRKYRILLCLLRTRYEFDNPYCPLRRSRGTSPIGEARVFTNLANSSTNEKLHSCSSRRDTKSRQETRQRQERSAGRGGQGERAVISGQKSCETTMVTIGNLFSASPPVVSLGTFLSTQESTAPQGAKYERVQDRFLFSILDRGYHAVTPPLCLLRNRYKIGNPYCPLRRSRGTSPIGEARTYANLVNSSTNENILYLRS